MALQFVGKDCGWINLPALDSQRPTNRPGNQAADAILLHLAKELLILGAFGGREDAEVINHQHLAQLFAQGHLSQGLLDPCRLRIGLAGPAAGIFL